MALLSAVCLLTLSFLFIAYKHLENRNRNRLPKGVRRLPGPAGLPIIGSVHELPENNSWMKFHEWGEKYGPIYQVNLAGVNHVWISRDKVAHDLLSKRSAIYSDRPHIPALEHDNRTSGQYLPLMSKNELWARQRKFGKQTIMDQSLKAAYHGYPELEAVRLLMDLIHEPSEYNVALESFVSRVTSRLAWGTATASDELKQRARELLIGVSPTGALGNKLPFIMSLPERWIKAKAWEARRQRTERKFFETMQHEVSVAKTEKAKTSWMGSFLDKKSTWGFASDLEGAYAVGMHGIAGALTIAAPMQSFCLALTHYPEFQPVLHEEIDRVLGDRPPTFSDLPNLPVLRSFIRETLRFRPPVPTGIPHESTKDDIYEGYHIPAGSVMHPLEWSISRDPEVFPEPEEFNPMRWLDPKYPTYQEPLSQYPTITQYSQFGYGRRMCQGMGVTEADLFVGLGSLAWLFSINAQEQHTMPSADIVPGPDSICDSDAESGYGSDGEDERKFFEKNAERIKRESWDHSQASTTSSSSRRTSGCSDEQGEWSPLRAKTSIGAHVRPTLHSNDSAICMPEELSADTSKQDTMLRLPGSEGDSTSSFPPKTMGDTTLHQSPGSSFEVPGAYPHEEETQDKLDPPKQPRGLAPSMMNFSTLLIAKPLPFKFDLRIRNKERADKVAREWMRLKMEGEFEAPRKFWGDSNSGTKETGWGEVFL